MKAPSHSRPTKIVSAKEKANLKRGGKNPGAGRPSNTERNSKLAAQCRKLLEDPWRLRTLIGKLRAGTASPQEIALLYYYGYGKPPDSLKIDGIAPSIKIIFEMPADECPPKPKK